KVAVADFDRGLLEKALAAAGQNRSAAAKALGVSRVTLHRWMKRYGMPAKSSDRES
ncbi:MAG: helix-turn-helix domain-containing protein, partial [Myxococcales bacterium]|nr:helix-turn-helix domain-containing protein [Myxococcales bacterium]